MSYRLACLAVLFAVAAAPAASAQVLPPPVMDQVILELAAEDWVETDTARVVAAVEAVLEGKEAGGVRDEVGQVLGQLAPGAEWRFLQFERSPDASGLERWFVLAEARLPEDTLGGIAERAAAASRPGLAVRIDSIEFKPTLAETEAARAELRRQIYAEVQAELDRLNAAFPDRQFRLASIDFVHAFQPLAADGAEMRLMEQDAAMSTVANFGGSFGGVAQRLALDAHVVLQAAAPLAPEKAEEQP